jgi:hypothetical protein
VELQQLIVYYFLHVRVVDRQQLIIYICMHACMCGFIRLVDFLVSLRVELQQLFVWFFYMYVYACMCGYRNKYMGGGSPAAVLSCLHAWVGWLVGWFGWWVDGWVGWG